MKQKTNPKTVARNKKAFHLYVILEKLEAGVSLQGTEVKAVRQGHVTMQESYAMVRNGEAYLEGVHISPYEAANRFNHDPKRSRKLLVHKREIAKLATASLEKGYTLVPLSLYFKRGKVKVELGIGRGKKLFDKRATVKERSAKRTIERAMKGVRQ